MTTPLPTSLPAAARPTLTVGHKNLTRAVVSIVESSRSDLHVAAFRLGAGDVLNAIEGAAQVGVRPYLLLDTDATPQKTIRRANAFAADVVTLGTDPIKQHSKAVVADQKRAVVATDLGDPDAGHRLELGVSFSDRPAATLAKLLAVSPDEPNGRLRVVAREAAAEGLLLNDADARVFHLTSALRDALGGATRTIRISTKAWDDEQSTQLLATNTTPRERTLITHEIPKEQRKRLEQAGVNVHVLDAATAATAGRELHGTALAVDGRALVTSAYVVTRVLDGSKQRRSRELGVAVDGDAARAVDQLIRGLL